MKSLKKISFDQYLLLFIIALAAVVRFWDLPAMQFMHDELSAVIRAQANSFGELIYKTKTTDVHPVGIPVFIHYWTRLFEQSVPALRIPFILCGLVSIYYSYKIAAKWFNPTVGIFTAACLATLQCSTMYGQLARPYASGMLFSVVLVWCWTQFLFGEKRKWKHMIGFVIFASLCFYDHYFCLLFAAIVAATGLFFLNRKNAVSYLLMCLAVVILFIPQANILLFHLSIGSGTEESWLGKPQPDWLVTFLKYLFHYSFVVYLMICGIFIVGIYFGRQKLTTGNGLRSILLIWAILGPLLAYLYSVWKTPVLQFSSFTFSLPFLFMFIFSFYPDLNRPMKTAILAALVLTNTYTLFADRKHYPLFYKQPYEQMALTSRRTIDLYGGKNVSIALSATEGFVDHYFYKYGPSFNYLLVNQPDIPAFSAYLDKQTTSYFVAGNLPLEYYQLIRERYPYTLYKEEGFTYTIYCFSKIKPESEFKEKILFSEMQRNHKSNFWNKNYISSELPQNPGIICMRLDSTMEYSAGFTTYLYEILNTRHAILNVSSEITLGDTSANPTLVIAIDDGKESMVWRGSEYQSYKREDGAMNKIYVSHLFSGMDLKRHPYASIKVYVWNRDKKEIWINNLKVEVIQANPMIYGLYEPIE